MLALVTIKRLFVKKNHENHAMLFWPNALQVKHRSYLPLHIHPPHIPDAHMHNQHTPHRTSRDRPKQDRTVNKLRCSVLLAYFEVPAFHTTHLCSSGKRNQSKYFPNDMWGANYITTEYNFADSIIACTLGDPSLTEALAQSSFYRKRG